MRESCIGGGSPVLVGQCCQGLRRKPAPWVHSSIDLNLARNLIKSTVRYTFRNISTGIEACIDFGQSLKYNYPKRKDVLCTMCRVVRISRRQKWSPP